MRELVCAVSSEANSWSEPIYIILFVHEPVCAVRSEPILGLSLSTLNYLCMSLYAQFLVRQILGLSLST